MATRRRAFVALVPPINMAKLAKTKQKTKEMKKIQIVNGPNLNLLGKREPGIYGSRSFESCLPALRERYPDVQIDYYQSNIEGELINKMQEDEEGDSLTILAGSDMDDESFEALIARIEEAQPDLEIDSHRGEQPLYPVIFSIE